MEGKNQGEEGEGERRKKGPGTWDPEMTKALKKKPTNSRCLLLTVPLSSHNFGSKVGGIKGCLLRLNVCQDEDEAKRHVREACQKESPGRQVKMVTKLTLSTETGRHGRSSEAGGMLRSKERRLESEVGLRGQRMGVWSS